MPLTTHVKTLLGSPGVELLGKGTTDPNDIALDMIKGANAGELVKTPSSKFPIYQLIVSGHVLGLFLFTAEPCCASKKTLNLLGSVSFSLS